MFRLFAQFRPFDVFRVPNLHDPRVTVLFEFATADGVYFLTTDGQYFATGGHS